MLPRIRVRNIGLPLMKCVTVRNCLIWVCISSSGNEDNSPIFKGYFKELYGVMCICHLVLFIWDHIKIYACWSPPAWLGISSISCQSVTQAPSLYYTSFLPWNLIMTSYSSFCSEDLSSRLHLPQLVTSGTPQTTLWFVIELGSKFLSSKLGSYFIRWASEQAFVSCPEQNCFHQYNFCMYCF